ncbi:recombinase family protein [Pseudomonas monteilii]|uniref:recombinase family protein n=1 Tax=Pseudomonas monteilii TaxID=76759 RepID=UPI000491AD07|nr:recombinase family protein [Pseudomonas monteilii]
MNVVAYYRVSTKGQGESGLGIEAQREYVERAAQQQGWNIIEEFEDVGVSGGLHPLERPEGAKAFATGYPVIVAKLDRLSRDVEHIAGLMKRNTFKVATMPNASTVELHIYAVLAEQERTFIKQRTKDALASLKKRAEAGDAEAVRKINNRAEAQAKGRAVADISAANTVRMAGVSKYQESIRPHLESCLYNKINTLQSVADCLNRKGQRSPRGSNFTATSVRRLMLALNVSF